MYNQCARRDDRVVDRTRLENERSARDPGFESLSLRHKNCKITMLQISAYLICLILIGLTIFQMLLIAGYPLGNYAWGGAHRILPRNLRIGSVSSIAIYAFIASIVLDCVGIIFIYENSFIGNSGIWILVVYFGLGIFLNGISRSKKERLVMTPIVTILFLLCLFIGLNT